MGSLYSIVKSGVTAPSVLSKETNLSGGGLYDTVKKIQSTGQQGVLGEINKKPVDFYNETIESLKKSDDAKKRQESPILNTLAKVQEIKFGFKDITDPRKFADRVLGAGYETIKGSVDNLAYSMADLVSSGTGFLQGKRSASEVVGKGINAIKANVDAFLSPVGALFSMAEQMPVVGTGMVPINEGIKAVDSLAKDSTSRIISSIPDSVMSPEAKTNLSGPVGDVLSMISQFALFAKFAPEKTASLKKEYVSGVLRNITEEIKNFKDEPITPQKSAEIASKIEREIVDQIKREPTPINLKDIPPETKLKDLLDYAKTQGWEYPTEQAPKKVSLYEAVVGEKQAVEKPVLETGEKVTPTKEVIEKPTGEIQPVEVAGGKVPAIEVGKSEITKPAKPIETGETKEFSSRVFDRVKSENPELKGELTASELSLKEDTQKAVELVAKDKQKAYRVAMGHETLPDVTSTSVNIAMFEKAMSEGNYTLADRLIRSRSLEQTRRGQEIVAEKGSITDNSASRYMKELISDRLDNLGSKYLSDIKDLILKTTKKERANKIIEREVAKVEGQIKNGKLDVNSALSLLDKMTCL